jgi:hypothetical protein
MNCRSAREIFGELLDGRTPATAHLEARSHLASCPDCQREFAALGRTLDALDTLPTNPPSDRMRRNFRAILETEKQLAASASAPEQGRGRPGLVRGRAVQWRWVLAPLAGCALVAAGFFAGSRVERIDIKSEQLAASSPASEAAAMRQELQELRAQISRMGTLVGYSLLQQQQPASERLRGVLTSAALVDPNEAAINELIGALAFDTSPNVRLRALEGLYPHAEQDVVRASVLASLPREQNPLVQVSMIDFLAAARDTGAKSTLERLSATEATDQNVRNAARRALTHL